MEDRMGVTAWATDNGSIGLALRECVRAATAAPSIYNSQPWQFRLRDGAIEVFADRRNLLTVIDPAGRELLMSVGAAVLNARVAMRALGRQPLLRLFPVRSEPDLVAQVRPGRFVAGSATAESLARAIPRRRTNRRPFADVRVPAEVLTELAAAARVEGAVLSVAGGRARDTLLDVVRTAQARLRARPGYLAELAEWTMASYLRTDGVPPEAFGPWSAADAVPLRDFGLVQSVRRRRTVRFERAPTIVVLSTPDDGPASWVRAGQAMERVLLTATVRGLSNTPMTQPLELADLRRLVLDPARGHVAQAILRLGYGPPCPPSPRRPVEAVLRPAAGYGTGSSDAMRPEAAGFGHDGAYLAGSGYATAGRTMQVSAAP
ncbi:MAG TPA: nitroreductase family protein [Micromonosporaceae bacterium]|nr:nitroreductase family protein [Micromonosporaceae bacterium]